MGFKGMIFILATRKDSSGSSGYRFGLRQGTPITIISEIGIDMEQFPNEHHLASWSGLSPETNESAGKKKVHESFTETNTSNQH